MSDGVTGCPIIKNLSFLGWSKTKIKPNFLPLIVTVSFGGTTPILGLTQ